MMLRFTMYTTKEGRRIEGDVILDSGWIGAVLLDEDLDTGAKLAALKTGIGTFIVEDFDRTAQQRVMEARDGWAQE